MNLPGFRVHQLKGFWSVTVRANWRTDFHFDDANALDMDFADYLWQEGRQ